MDFSKLQHPGWWELVVPIGLAIGSKFTPETVRSALLIAAVGAVAWTVHHTAFGAGRWKVTGIAAAICSILAIVVFFFGRAVDAQQKTKEPKSHAMTTPLPPVVASSARRNPPAAIPQSPAKATSKDAPIRSESGNRPSSVRSDDAVPPTRQGSTTGTSTGPVTVQPGAVASFGQQGGQTANMIINNPSVDYIEPNALVLSKLESGLLGVRRKYRLQSQTVSRLTLTRKSDTPMVGRPDWTHLKLPRSRSAAGVTFLVFRS